MANNPPPFAGLPGPPPQPPMLGAIGPPQTLGPPMPAQFRPVFPVHPPQQYVTTAPSQYQPLGHGVSAMNSGVPPPPPQATHSYAQFSQPMQPPSVRSVLPSHLPPMSQAVPLPTVQPNRPTFVPVSGNQGVAPLPSYTFMPSSSYGQQPLNSNVAGVVAQHQPVSQINSSNAPVGAQPSLPPANHGAVSFTPILLNGLPSSVPVATNQVNIQPKSPGQSSSDWLEHTSADGRKYYYNKKSKKSTWGKPLELMTLTERADATTDWKEYTSPDGRKYYFNSVTQKSKWTIPDELKLARERAENASCIETQAGAASGSSAPPPPNPPVSASSEFKIPTNAGASDSKVSASLSSPSLVSPVNTAQPVPAAPALSPLLVKDSPQPVTVIQSPAETMSGSSGSAVISLNSNAAADFVETKKSLMCDSNNPSVKEAVPSEQAATVPEAEEAKESPGVAGKVNPSADDREEVYSSKLEAKNAFKSLLESANVESDWNWDQAMRVIINDKRYGALRSLGERKQAFIEYLAQKKKLEAEERRAKQRRAREDFRQMLEDCDELTSTTKWSKAVTMFGDDDRFKAVERSRDREDIFEDYVAELQKKERAKADEELKRNKVEYRKFLESCEFIKANSQWRKVQDRLEADERCSRLEKIDRLEMFQEYVHDLEKEEEEQRKIQKEEIRKAERKNRDDFRNLMNEHVAAGSLNAKTSWRDYHSKVKDMPAYQAVSSNSSGSTPKELFEDVVEELLKQYEEDKIRIKDAMKLEKVTLSSNWTLEDFKSAIDKEMSFQPVAEINLKLVFDDLLERAREKEEKEAKRRKRLRDEFFSLICSLKGLTASSQFEDYLPLFKETEEYRSIGDEAFMKQIFDEYAAQLKEKEKEKERKRKEEKARKEKERQKDKRSKERREKDRRRDKDKKKERNSRDGSDSDNAEFDGSLVSSSGKEKDRKHRKRRHDGDDDSRNSRKHNSDRKKFRHSVDSSDSEVEGKHKRHKKEHRDGSHRTNESEELEDGEVGFIFLEHSFDCAFLVKGEAVRVQGDEFWHMTKVLRLGVNDRVEVFNGKGGLVEGSIERIDRSGVELIACENPRLELGASSVTPLLTDRSPSISENRADRLQRVVVAASKQCQRLHEMILNPSVHINNIKSNVAQSKLTFVATAEATPILSVLTTFSKESKGSLIVGPEGDFTEKELKSMIEVGATPVGLGPHRLRVETATVALLTAVMLWSDSQG
ncbi:Pre-mRNA-processing protein 40A-like protein [Drosera capensis]